MDDACCEYGYVPMADGTRLAVVVWRPMTEGRYPTLLHYTPYATSAASFDDVRRFLQAGYAYVGANVRGTGCSEGAFSYYQPVEGQDGAELVEWAAAQLWSTGNVGMIGGSYGGHTQIKVAALRPPHLKAITPFATEGNEYRDEAMAGGLFNAGLMAHWSFEVQPARAATGVAARGRQGDRDGATIVSRQPPNPAFHEVQQHPLYDEWWHARALDAMAARVEVPTLIVHGWQDEWIRPNGAMRLFRLLRSRQKRLILQNGPHRLSDRQCNQYEQMRWLDRWVKGERNGIEQEDPVKIFWEVRCSQDERRAEATPSWATTYDAWPPRTLKWVELRLTEARTLEDPEASRTPLNGAPLTYIYPIGTELVGDDEQFAPSPHPLGTLSYRTAPLREDLTLLGAPRLTLYLSCEQDDTDFLFTLKDIDPDGNALYVQRGGLRASMRAVDAEQSTPDEVVQSFTERAPLVPGDTYEIRVSLAAIGHALRAGHQLELSILSPSATPDPVWGFAPSSQPSLNTVYHSARHPSALYLPIIPDERARAPAPKLGTLENQPWRAAAPLLDA